MKQIKTKVWLVIAAYILICCCGCSMQEQSAKYNEYGCLETAKVWKVNFLYWSKFQADTNTCGMTVDVKNAEGRPDAEAIEAFFTSPVIQAVMKMLGE